MLILYLAARMSDYLNIADFLSPVNLSAITDDEGYKDGQLGKFIDVYEETFPDLDEAHFVIVGCGEIRGSGVPQPMASGRGAATRIRELL